MSDLQARFAEFGLTLHPDKTRLIEFGRFAAINRRHRGQGRPATFDFLGFTHCCGQGRRGRFQIVRLTAKKRMRATLRFIRTALMRRRHEPVAVTGRWLNRVVQGYFNYHAVPTNLKCLDGVLERGLSRLAACVTPTKPAPPAALGAVQPACLPTHPVLP